MVNQITEIMETKSMSLNESISYFLYRKDFFFKRRNTNHKGRKRKKSYKEFLGNRKRSRKNSTLRIKNPHMIWPQPGRGSFCWDCATPETPGGPTEEGPPGRWRLTGGSRCYWSIVARRIKISAYHSTLPIFRHLIDIQGSQTTAFYWILRHRSWANDGPGS